MKYSMVQNKIYQNGVFVAKSTSEGTPCAATLELDWAGWCSSNAPELYSRRYLVQILTRFLAIITGPVCLGECWYSTLKWAM
jgi:hypothetical protein